MRALSHRSYSKTPKASTGYRFRQTLIDELSVAPSPVQAGGVVSIRYSASGQSGDVWLVDAARVQRGRTATSQPAGLTQFAIPAAAAGKDIRVVVHAQRGQPPCRKQRTGYQVVTVAYGGGAVQANGVSAATAPNAAKTPGAPQIAPELRAVLRKWFRPATASPPQITGVKGDVRITMMSATGTTVAEGDVGQGGALSLNAPNVHAPTTYFVVATLTNGVAQQSIMKRLVVTPR